jgi:transposase
VWSCYEAGRDAFWPHRLLTAEGIHNLVVDSSSIEVNRRARHAKTDRLDAQKLRRSLMRYLRGEREVWQVVRVPTVEMEAARHASRTVAMLTGERTRWRNRIHSLLATEGIRLRVDGQLPTRVASARCWDGRPIPAPLQARVQVAWEVLQQIEAHWRRAQQEQRVELRLAATAAAATARRLTQLRAVGERFAWVLATELCSRDLRNRREVGGLTGFTTVPYQSGAMVHDQGISRAGLAQLRGLAVEMAWVWVQWQPESELTRWFEARWGRGGPKARRVGTALSHRVVALWPGRRRAGRGGLEDPSGVSAGGLALTTGPMPGLGRVPRPCFRGGAVGRLRHSARAHTVSGARPQDGRHA